MFDWLSSKPELITAFLSFFAAVAAALAAWRAPISAAKYSEKLRRETQKIEQNERMKLYVFTTLMQERAVISSGDSVKALNLIDVVFSSSPEVRDCWSELFTGFQKERLAPDHLQDDRKKRLLAAMANDLGLSTTLRMSDFERTYYPEAIALESEARRLQHLETLNRLRGASGPAANSTLDSNASVWPPAPT